MKKKDIKKLRDKYKENGMEKIFDAVKEVGEVFYKYDLNVGEGMIAINLLSEIFDDPTYDKARDELKDFFNAVR